MFDDQGGFLRRYPQIVRQLLQRDREVDILETKNVPRHQAENIVTPTKPQIAVQNSVSLSHVQNVHRVMRETRRLKVAAA